MSEVYDYEKNQFLDEGFEIFCRKENDAHCAYGYNMLMESRFRDSVHPGSFPNKEVNLFEDGEAFDRGVYFAFLDNQLYRFKVIHHKQPFAGKTSTSPIKDVMWLM